MPHRIDAFILRDELVTVEDLVSVSRYYKKVELSSDIRKKIENSRKLVEKFVDEKKVVYGVTTGLGDLCNISIDTEDLEKLSKNIVLSHACGIGENLPKELVRAIMFSNIVNYSKGYSGIRLKTVETLISMLNVDLIPLVPSQGSVGYLSHLAHIALVMIGHGEAEYEAKKMSGLEAMEKAGIPILKLKAKEGLALVNGTACMTGISSMVLHEAEQISKWADISSALSFEALRGLQSVFDERIHQVKLHPGQKKVASNLRTLTKGSKLIQSTPGNRVQDALSIRSIPQVHGACRDKFGEIKLTIERELNSATDNPLVFSDDDKYGEAISSSNPHGESVAIAMDGVAIALSEFGSISERRIARLINSSLSGLPAFLINKSGLNSGLMIPQYVAASLVAENKIYSHPISVDSIPTSGFQEDHVSMGTPASLKAYSVLKNVQKIIAIELLTSTQALEFHNKNYFGNGTYLCYQLIRKYVPSITEDREFYKDINEILKRIIKPDWLSKIEIEFGEL